MKRYRNWMVSAVLIAIAFASGAGQESEKSKVAEPSANRQENLFYRLDYTVRELDGSKVLSKRSYSTGIRTDNVRREMRTGTRVPVATGAYQPGDAKSAMVNTQWQYIDVGVNIDSRAQETGDTLSLEVTADMSSIAPAEPSTNGVTNHLNNPLIRQVRGSATVSVTPNRPALVFAADEPTSSHRFELEVVATRIR
jgi:hypothetical protein